MEINENKFEELVQLIEEYDLHKEQVETLLTHCLGIFEDPTHFLGKDELIAKLRDYWAKYGEQLERPLFL